jgi:hypothetical protein
VEWGERVRKTLFLDVPHRQVIFVIPKMLRVFFKFKRKLLAELCRAAIRTLLLYFQAATGREIEPGVIAVIEAGRSSYTMVDVLADLGIETTVAHPKEVKAIAKAKVKTDQRDSYKLAHLLRTGYIPEVYKRSRDMRRYPMPG